MHPESPVYPNLTLADVLDTVAEHFGLTPQQLRDSRDPYAVYPRQLATLLAYRYVRPSYSWIAARLGQHHTTTHHAVTVMLGRMTPDMERMLARAIIPALQDRARKRTQEAAP